MEDSGSEWFFPKYIKDGYFFEGLNIVINTFCTGFQGLSKAFRYLSNFFAWNFLLILKMLPEILLKIPFSVIDVIVWRENSQELTCHRRLSVWLQCHRRVHN